MLNLLKQLPSGQSGGQTSKGLPGVVREIGVRKSKLLLKQSESSNHLQALPRAIVKRAATAKSRTTKGGEFRSDMLLANEIIVEALKLI